MLDLMGVEFLLNSVLFQWEKAKKEELYNIYVTDTLREMTKYTALASGYEVNVERYYNYLNPPKKETRTEQEIINSIRAKLNN